jgi:hypothetical protein
MTGFPTRISTEDHNSFAADALDKLLIALTGVLAMITILAVA